MTPRSPSCVAGHHFRMAADRLATHTQELDWTSYEVIPFAS